MGRRIHGIKMAVSIFTLVKLSAMSLELQECSASSLLQFIISLVSVCPT